MLTRTFLTNRRRLGTLVVLLVATGVFGAVLYRKVFYFKKFAAVTPGKLYRSGSLRPWQLRSVIGQHGIRTVYALTFTGNSQEYALCDELGVRRHFHYLPGDGVGTDDPYLRFLELASNPENLPMLVHCSAGVQRTGGAVALYRTLIEGWAFDDAIAEMIAMGNEGKAEQIQQLRRIHDRWLAQGIANAASSARR